MKYIIDRSKTSDSEWIVTVWQVVDSMPYEKEQDAIATMSILSSALKTNKCNEVALRIDGKPVI